MSSTEHKRKAFVVGLGGHCNAVIAMIESSTLFQIEGLVDTANTADLNESKLGYPVKGTLQELLLNESRNFDGVIFVAIGDNQERAEVFQKLLNAGYELPDLVSSTAVVHRSVTLGGGNVIGHFCLLNAGAEIGSNNILNSRSTLEHDVKVGSHCHVAPGATLCGKVNVADHCLIGAGAVVVPNISIPEHTTLGAGGVMVQQSIMSNRTYVGVPATMLKHNKTGFGQAEKGS